MDYFIPTSTSDLYRLVSEKAEESPYLEFKSARLLEKNWESLKVDLSKYASAFANSGGGITILGIEEDERNCARELRGYQGSRFDASHISSAVLDNIKPRHPKIDVTSFFDATGVIFCIHSPMSYSGPHQARDKKFYARHQFRCEPMEPFEIDLIRLRRDALNDGVFGGLAIDGGILCALVENLNNHPIFNAKLNVPSEQRLAMEYQRDLLVSGISVLPARSTTKVFLGSIINLIAKPEFAEAFDYSFEYSLEPNSHARSLGGRLSLGELRGTMLIESDAEKLRDTIKKGLGELKHSIGNLSSQICSELEDLTDPTGLAISYSSLEKLKLLIDRSQDLGKWRGEWLSAEGFMELLSVDRKCAQQLYRIFDAVRYQDVDQRKPLSAHGWIGADLLNRLRKQVEMPDWMLAE